MKIQKNLFMLGVSVALMGLASTSATAANVIGNATGEVVAPLSIAEDVTMNFGTLNGGAAAGTVVLDFVNGRTITGGAEILLSGPGLSGEFTITGQSGQVYTLGISASATIGDGLGNTMTVNNFLENSLGTLPAATETFQVGATLLVNINQPAGTYSTATGGSTYTVTVNYN